MEEENQIDIIKETIFENVKVCLKTHVQKPPNLHRWESVRWSTCWDNTRVVHEIIVLVAIKVIHKSIPLMGLKSSWWTKGSIGKLAI